MKVIFLDIDGVLNSLDWYMRRAQYDKSNFVARNWIEELDPIAVRRLIYVLEETGANIVISSTWRRLHTLTEIAGYLDVVSEKNYVWWSERIIGKTPVMDSQTNGLLYVAKVRGDEIKDWLENYTSPIYQYVIVDDDSDMLPEQKSNFVHTSHDNGLTLSDTNKMIEILNG